MIDMNAPPVLLFSLDEPNKSDENELSELEALPSKNEEQLSKYEELKSKVKNFVDNGGLLNWVPIIIDADISQTAPNGYDTATTKTIQIVGGVPLLTASANTTTIRLKTNNGMLVNMLLSLADMLFSKKDSFPRIHFFSKEIFVIGGTLLSMTRSISMNTTEQIITLQLQKGGADTKLSKTKEVEVTEVAPMGGGLP